LVLQTGGGPAGFDPLDLADRLCTVWLRQALLGRFFPVGVGGNSVALLSDGRLVFTGVCSSVSLSYRVDISDRLRVAIAGKKAAGRSARTTG
jgi:hypothetical protein